MLGEGHAQVIERQRLFFLASAPAWSADGPYATHIELQPKAGMTLAIVDRSTVAFADVSSSGSRVATHLRARGSGSLTLLIVDTEGGTDSDGLSTLLRLSGRGFAVSSNEIEPDILAAFPADEINTDTSSRWVFILRIEHVQYDCDSLSPALLLGAKCESPSSRSPYECRSDENEGYPQDPYRAFSSAVVDFDLAAIETQYELLHGSRSSQSRLGSIPEDDVQPTPTTGVSARQPAVAPSRGQGARHLGAASSQQGASRPSRQHSSRAQGGGSVPAREYARFDARPRLHKLLHATKLPLASALLGIGAATLAFEGAALVRMLLTAVSRRSGVQARLLSL